MTKPLLANISGTVRLMESFHSFTASHTIYFDTVTRFGRAEINSYSLSANAATETLITVLVQVRVYFLTSRNNTLLTWSSTKCFYSHRIYRLSKGNLSISIACFTLAILRFLFGVAVSAESVIDVHRTPNWVVFVTDFNWLITTMLAVGGAADILIAFSMLVYLRKMSSRTNMKSCVENHSYMNLKHDPDDFSGQQMLSTGWCAGRYVSTECVSSEWRNWYCIVCQSPAFLLGACLTNGFLPRLDLNTSLASVWHPWRSLSALVSVFSSFYLINRRINCV